MKLGNYTRGKSSYCVFSAGIARRVDEIALPKID